jgi:hypothetical protein
MSGPTALTKFPLKQAVQEVQVPSEGVQVIPGFLAEVMFPNQVLAAPPHAIHSVAEALLVLAFPAVPVPLTPGRPIDEKGFADHQEYLT